MVARGVSWPGFFQFGRTGSSYDFCLCVPVHILTRPIIARTQGP